MKYVWGVDVGGTSIKIGFFRESGELEDDFEINTRKEDSGKNILPDIADAILKFMKDRKISKDDVWGIGLALPGPGLDVCAGNDGNMAALGEMWQGAARGYLNAVMITLGTGIGGGVIAEGSVISGHRGSAGEIGHIHVNDDEDEACTCGNKGCVEQYASATGIVRLAGRELAKDDTPSSLRGLENLTARDVFTAARSGDKIAGEVIRLFGYYLGQAIGSVITILAPDVVVIGGGVSKAGSILVEAVEEYYRDYTFHACKDVPLVLARLGNKAGIYGAARLVINRNDYD